MAKPLDKIDRHLLQLLQHDADQTLHELGAQIGLSAAATHRRIARHEASGLIVRSVAVLNPSQAALAVNALCLISCASDGAAELGGLKQRLSALPEVQHCYELTGEIDLAAVFVVPDMATYSRLTREVLGGDKNVVRFETHVVLEVVKSTSEIPL